MLKIDYLKRALIRCITRQKRFTKRANTTRKTVNTLLTTRFQRPLKREKSISTTKLHNIESFPFKMFLRF